MKSVLCVLAWSMPGVAMAMTTAEYLGHCQQASTYDRAVCAGYLDALLEGRLRAETQPGATVAVAAAVASDGAAFEVPVAYRDGYCLPDGATLPQLRDIVVIKRSMGRGYAGIDNLLYTNPKTGMLFADAKAGLEQLTQAVKAL